MFQFRRFPTYDYFIHHTLTGLLQPGCPIRKSPDITPAYGSPRLIAVNHVLHRLPVPRHSPCALCSLTFFMRSSKTICWVIHSLIIVFNYPFLKNTMTFQDGRHSILSLVCLALLCSVFKVRFFSELQTQNSILKFSLKYWSLLSKLHSLINFFF